MNFRLILLFTLLIQSLSAFAGDLTLVCYRNGDNGDFVALDQAFADSGNTTSLQFEYKESDFVILVERESMFANFNFEMIKIKKNSLSFEKISATAPGLYESVRLDQDLECEISD